MSVSLEIPTGSSVEFTSQGVSLKITEDTFGSFRESVNLKWEMTEEEVHRQAEEEHDRWYRDLSHWEIVGEGLIVCEVEPGFWNYAIKKNGGELILDYTNNDWDPKLGECFHPDFVFSIGCAPPHERVEFVTDGKDWKGVWKLPKFTPAYPVLRKGMIELDKAVVDLSKCYKFEGRLGNTIQERIGTGYVKEMNEQWMMEFEQFMGVPVWWTGKSFTVFTIEQMAKDLESWDNERRGLVRA